MVFVRSRGSAGRLARLVWLMLGPAVLAACQSEQTTQAGAVGVDRQQTMTSLVSSREIEQQASQQYAQILAQAQKKGLLNQDPDQVRRVRAIAARLVPQVDAFRADAVKWKWEVNVLTSKDINAWCMPGGKIAVYTGLIERLKLTDDELAAVMGHEIAHALREHARERMGRQMATQTATVVGAIALEIFTGVRLDPQLAGTFTQAMFVLPNSRRVAVDAPEQRSAVARPAARRRQGDAALRGSARKRLRRRWLEVNGRRRPVPVLSRSPARCAQ